MLQSFWWGLVAKMLQTFWHNSCRAKLHVTRCSICKMLLSSSTVSPASYILILRGKISTWVGLWSGSAMVQLRLSATVRRVMEETVYSPNITCKSWGRQTMWHTVRRSGSMYSSTCCSIAQHGQCAILWSCTKRPFFQILAFCVKDFGRTTISTLKLPRYFLLHTIVHFHVAYLNRVKVSWLTLTWWKMGASERGGWFNFCVFSTFSASRERWHLSRELYVMRKLPKWRTSLWCHFLSSDPWERADKRYSNFLEWNCISPITSTGFWVKCPVLDAEDGSGRKAGGSRADHVQKPGCKMM